MTDYLRNLPRIKSYAEAKRHYESIKPYNGKYVKKTENVRPYGSRKHVLINIYKGRGYYALRSGVKAWGHDLVRWYKNGSVAVSPISSLGYSFMFETVASALPVGVQLVDYHHSRYLRVNYNYYRLSTSYPKPYVFRPVNGSYELDPRTYRQEYKYFIKPNIRATISKKTKPFLDYLKTMEGLLRATDDGKLELIWNLDGRWQDVLRRPDEWHQAATSVWKQQCLRYNHGVLGYRDSGQPLDLDAVKQRIIKCMLTNDSHSIGRTPIGPVLHYDRYRFHYEWAVLRKARERARRRKNKLQNK